MNIHSIQFVHLLLPFKRGFAHAQKTRSVSDTILVRVEASNGTIGMGEILPRSYVSGETVAGILGDDGQVAQAGVIAQALLGQSFSTQDALTDWVEHQLPAFDSHTALFGGVELALWNVLCQNVDIDFARLIGPVRQRPTGKCITIGFDAPTDLLRRYAIDARLKGATVVKLKIGLPDDIDRLQLLNEHLKGKLPVRVDANAGYNFDRAEALLAACVDTTALQSMEEPFDHRDVDMIEQLLTLHARFGVDFVADESVCSLSDARRWQEKGCFQVYNLRVGKHGGLLATCKIRDFAAQNGMGLVSGSMVGETGVLTQASELLLSRSTQFDYVEGLGQNIQFLKIDPVFKLDYPCAMKPLRMDMDKCSDLIQKTVIFD